MFIAAWFTAAKICKQPVPINRQMNTGDVIHTHTHTHTLECYSVIKNNEENFAILSDMDGPAGHYAKWNKSDRERQILYDFTYVWNLKNKTNITEEKQNHMINRWLPGKKGLEG